MAKKLELISLNDIIPNSISGDKNVQSIVKSIAPELKKVSQDIREAFLMSRIRELPEKVIDLLAWQWHVDSYEPDLPIATKRELVLDSIKWHRKKGTKAAIKNALEKLDFVPTISEWFETGTKPHTFGVRGYYKNDPLNVKFLGDKTEELLTRIVEITKPVRSKLLHLIVAPIPIDMKKHTCYWDICEWGHADNKLTDGGVTIFPILEDNPPAGIEIFQGINTVDDIQYWNTSTWGGTPVRILPVGQEIWHGIYAELDRRGATWRIPYNWGDFTWNDSERYSLDFGLRIEQKTQVDSEIKEQSIGCAVFIGIYASFRPYWDFYTWRQHGTWGHDLGVPRVFYSVKRDTKASLQWPVSEAPIPKWSKFRTWRNGSWKKGTAVAGTWETGKWTPDKEGKK